MLQCTDIRLWHISSYTITAKPIKSLEWNYPMIQLLIKSYTLDVTKKKLEVELNSQYPVIDTELETITTFWIPAHTSSLVFIS